jgi:lipopolysaccharide transport system ATP-binding protein
MKNIIEVENLSKRYRISHQKKNLSYFTLRDEITEIVRKPFDLLTGRRSNKEELWALKNITFNVRPGEVLGLIGPNGSGKTTLLKLLTRITAPTTGKAIIEGRIGSLLEVGTGFHPELTGRENVYLNGAILGMRKIEIDKKFEEIVAFAEIEKFLDTPLKRYSSGMGVRLAFSVAVHLDPDILLMDEALAVGDLSFQRKCLKKMGNVAQEGKTIIFVSHDMQAVRNLCQNVIWLEKGQIKQIGNAQEVINNYEKSNI